MSSSLNTPARPLSPPGAKRTLRDKWSANPTALASLVFSVVWIVGVGSVVGIVLGIKSTRKARGITGSQDGIGLANAGIVIGLVGIVLAAIFWTGVAGIGGSSVSTSSPSYIDGRNYAAENYPNSTSEASLCDKSNAQSYDNPTQWVKGCHDAWYITVRAVNGTGMPGLNA